MSLPESRLPFVRLNNSNYQIWKFKAEMLLIRDDLWDTVYDSLPDEPSDTWLKKNRQARALIGLMVEDDQLTHIRNLATAKGMWDALRGVHERSNLCSKLFLLRKLYRKRLEKGQAMREHINAMMETVDELRALGEELKDNHVAALLLCSLPDSYSSLITALEARPEKELTLEYVRGKLMDEHDRRHENENVIHTSDEMALNTKFRKTKFNKESRTCYFCNKQGHLKKDCRLLKSQNSKFKNQKAKAAKGFTSGNSATIEETPKEIPADAECCFSMKEIIKHDKWYIDSGATSHMIGNKSFFTSIKEFKNPMDIFMADGSVVKAYGIGEGKIQCKLSSEIFKTVNLKEVLYVPNIEGNLISVKRLDSLGYVLIFSNKKCEIKYKNNLIAVAKLDPFLYELDVMNCVEKANKAYINDHIECIHTWHRRMGHRNPEDIKMLDKNHLVTGLNIKKCGGLYTCVNCIKGKTSNKPFPKASENRSVAPFQLIHSDVCGPMRTPTHQGMLYFLTLIDDYSRYTEIHLMKRKSEAEELIKEFIAKGTNKFQKGLQTLRTDGGGEYISTEFNNYLRKSGIKRQISIRHSPQQNGLAERKNRTIVETARCMLSDANLNNTFWGEAVKTAVYLQNRLPHKSCKLTPYQLWNGTAPDIKHIRIFGCQAFAFIPKDLRHKFSETTQEGILLGYSEESKGYRVMLKGSKKVVTARCVKFIERSSGLVPNSTEPGSEDNESITNLVDPETQIKTIDSDLYDIGISPTIIKETDEDCIDKITTNQDTLLVDEQLQNVRRSERVNKGVPPKRYAYQATLQDTSLEPNTWEELMDLPSETKSKWLKATDEEIDSLYRNQTWDLVKLPKEKKTLGTRWVFKLKSDHSGDEHHRARLVAKGYLQKFGEDFDSVFAPVVRFSTIRTLLAIASKRGMKTRHIDAKSAFLQGELKEEIYIDQPPGYIKPGQEHLVCRLKKSIYGLRQSARVWNLKVNSFLLNLGFKRGEADNCLYIKDTDGKLTYLLLYVDDILKCADVDHDIFKIKTALEKEFDIKDLGPATSYLGIQIEHTTDSITLCQNNKINSLLNKFGLLDAKEVATPMETSFMKDSNKDSTLLPNNTLYREGVGSLLYLSVTTRPDISIATSILARRVEKPNKADLNALKRVLKYLKGTVNKKIVYRRNSDFALEVYTDADWAGDSTDRKSTSGCIFMLGGALISWASKKQSSVSISSSEAEYVSAAYAVQEAIWMKRLLNDCKYPIHHPILIHEDNQACIAMVKSEKTNARTKHIDIRFHFLKDLQEKGLISFVYCPTEIMLADLFTKPLARPRFEELLDKLGII